MDNSINLQLGIAKIGDLLLRGMISEVNGDKPLENIELVIPNYQRPYKWTAKNAIQLLDDIIEAKNDNKEVYRVGTLILHYDKDNDQWDELYGDSKSFVGIQANPFCRFYQNKNKMITLRKNGMDYIYFPTLRCLSNSYERIVYYGIDIENGQPYAIGYKNGYLAVIYSNSETRCEYNYISSPISNHVLAISSCGGYEGRLKSVCEIINLKRVHEEGGYIFITDTIAWKEYQQLFHDKKLTFEKYSKYEGGRIKSIRIPFLNDKIIQLGSQDQDGKKEIMCKTLLERIMGIDIYSAMDIHWKTISEMVEENN